MNILNTGLAVVLATYSLSASAWLSTNAAPAYGAIGAEAFNAQTEKLARARKELMKELIDHGERAAQAGVSISLDEFVSLHNELRTFNSGSLSMEYLQKLTEVQNAVAEQHARQR